MNAADGLTAWNNDAADEQYLGCMEYTSERRTLDAWTEAHRISPTQSEGALVIPRVQAGGDRPHSE
jgi:hypothetical protein